MEMAIETGLKSSKEKEVRRKKLIINDETTNYVIPVKTGIF